MNCLAGGAGDITDFDFNQDQPAPRFEDTYTFAKNVRPHWLRNKAGTAPYMYQIKIAVRDWQRMQQVHLAQFHLVQAANIAPHLRLVQGILKDINAINMQLGIAFGEIKNPFTRSTTQVKDTFHPIDRDDLRAEPPTLHLEHLLMQLCIDDQFASSTRERVKVSK